MEMQLTTTGKKVLIRLSGEMYVDEAAKFREAVTDNLQLGCIHFIIDVSGVTYIDSSGLGALVALQKRALEREGSVVIKGLNGMMKKLFELTRLIRVFEIEP